ncbi:MAG: hypothetical protein JXK93_08210 [Sphaerochaetaceae bacterium]|nr:hypothetical protein [Sphaerochaetaceae bacterium]
MRFVSEANRSVASRRQEEQNESFCSIAYQIPDNYEKVVRSTDILLRFKRNGIRQRNCIEFLLDDART